MMRPFFLSKKWSFQMG